MSIYYFKRDEEPLCLSIHLPTQFLMFEVSLPKFCTSFISILDNVLSQYG